MKKLHICAASHKGQLRNDNEDAFIIGNCIEREGMVSLSCPYDTELFKQNGIFLGVADGMGGHQHGALASWKTLQIISTLAGTLSQEVLSHPAVAERISKTILDAHQHLIQFGESHNPPSNLGTTVIGLYLRSDEVIAFQVGDSRLYRVRDKYLNLLTRDHCLSAGAPALQAGETEQAPVRSSVLTNSIGGGSGVRCTPELRTDLIFHPGDLFLLCSDGLSDMVQQMQLEEIMVKPLGIEDKAKELIEAANLAGGNDNITVLLVTLTEESSEQ